MKTKAILVSLTLIVALMTAMVLASAAPTITDGLNLTIKTTVNDAEADTAGIVISEKTGTTLPVTVQVTNNENQTLTDARVKVEILNADVEAETGKDEFLSGKTYTKHLSLKLPSSLKISPSKDYRLVVTVTADEGDFRAVYDPFTVQREPYSIEILSVDAARSATAGSVLSVDVVLKNRGSHEAEDNFVVVRIPSLNVEKKAYFSDMTPTDENNNDDDEDAREGVISIRIPSDAKAGVYDLEVEASNDDSSTTTTKRISILGLEQGSDVLVSGATKDIASGTTATYDLIIVNSGNRIAVYEIVPESAQNLVLSVDEPIVTVPADSSRVVKVKASAGNVMGTFNFAVNVNSQGQLVKKVNLTANVVKGGVISTSNNVIILTVVLAIIFVVLLVVLIVLLTRKPAKSEEFEESYY